MAEDPSSGPPPSLVLMPPQPPRHTALAPTPAPTSPKEAPAPKATGGTGKLQYQKFPLPKLRLEIRDLNHAGSQEFLSVTAGNALQLAVQDVLSLLYHSPNSTTTTVPSTRSVTLILRPMPGVAYTTGSELDGDHKEIHFSLDYIHTSVSSERKAEEIRGVLTHEMVHCYQYDGFGACPGGLIEGIADWVRLNAGLPPPHWRKEADGNWDAGYQHTGYFLEYLEQRFGPGLVRRANEKLRIERYDEKKFWTELCGRPVDQLWTDYGEAVEKDTKKGDDDECILVEREDAGTPKNNQVPNKKED